MGKTKSKDTRTMADKMLGKLDMIDYQTQELHNIRRLLEENNQIMRLMLEATSFLMLATNRACPKFGKEFEEQIKLYSPFKKYSWFADKKDWNK